VGVVEDAQWPAGVGVPDSDGVVEAGGGEELAVGAVGDVFDRAGVGCQRDHDLVGGDVEDADLAAVAGVRYRELCSVGAEPRGLQVDGVAEGVRVADLDPGCGVPDVDLAAGRAGGQVPAVGAIAGGFPSAPNRRGGPQSADVAGGGFDELHD